MAGVKSPPAPLRSGAVYGRQPEHGRHVALPPNERFTWTGGTAWFRTEAPLECSTQLRHRCRRQHHAPLRYRRRLCSKVSFAFDDHVVLRDISFSVPKGSMKILLGPSGAGKSVVLKLILGLLRPDSGSDPRQRPADREHDRAGSDGCQGGHRHDVPGKCAVRFADRGRERRYRLYEETDMPLDQVRRRVEEVLGFVGLKEYIDTVPSELSGGQRRRVAVARAMAAKPSLLLFDDPTSGLDPITAATIDDQI